MIFVRLDYSILHLIALWRYVQVMPEPLLFTGIPQVFRYAAMLEGGIIGKPGRQRLPVHSPGQDNEARKRNIIIMIKIVHGIRQNPDMTCRCIKLEHIFDEYEQAQPQRNARIDTGPGPSIYRYLVKMQDVCFAHVSIAQGGGKSSALP